MKERLNHTIDKKLIPLSKKYAKKNGLSVSQLVEELLRNETQKGKASFSSKWRGRFTKSEKTDNRSKELRKRYSL